MLRILCLLSSILCFGLCSCKKEPPRPTTKFMDAAKGGSVDQLKSHFYWGCDVNQRDKSGMTPLHWAVRSGNLEAVKLLIEKGALVNELNGDKVSPAYLAEQAKREDLVRLLKIHGGKSIKPPPAPDPAEGMIRHTNAMLEIIGENMNDCKKLLDEVKAYKAKHRAEFKKLSRLGEEMIEKLSEAEKSVYARKMMKQLEPVLKKNMVIMMKLSEKCPAQVDAIGKAMRFLEKNGDGG